MHKYLRSVGFSEFITKKQIDDFFDENLKETNLVSSYVTLDKRIVGQYKINVCSNIGLSIIGEQEKDSKRVIDYYYPCSKGYDWTRIEECTIERYSDKDSFAGIIDDHRLGVALIFYLNNSNEYNSILRKLSPNQVKIEKIYLSALSVEGKIILPTISDEGKEENKNDANDDIDFNQNNKFVIDNSKFAEEELIKVRDSDDLEIQTNEFNDADIDIIETGVELPNYDDVNEDFFNSITERSKKEDLYTIVDTSLVPCGIECDKYNVIAKILSVSNKTNNFTGEKLVEMRVVALNFQFNLVINEKDLIGEPKKGRRFKGTIWLQGEIEFLTLDKKEKEI